VLSENLERVRSIYADWERGNLTSTVWAHPEIEYVVADGPDPTSRTGVVGMAEAWRGTLIVLYWDRKHALTDLGLTE
jgi:hypothetical protein